MVVQIRSAALAALAAGCGLGLYHFDNWYETLANAWVKVCLDYAEMLLMGPGMGLLVWMLVERVRLRDNTHRRAMRHEHEERFVMLGRIAASVAHEMRNPLQIMRLVAEELRATARGTDTDLLDRLDHSLVRLDQTVMLAYELARPMRLVGDADGVAINLCTLVDEILAEIQRRSGTTLRIDHVRPIVAPRVMARDHALRIVVSNLLRNALEAAAGQLVTISYRTDTAVQLVIRNPGRLPDELLAGDDLVASSKPEGLGIGIAIARHLSGAIGGTITYRNLDQLAETSITLPAAPSPMTPITTESNHAEDPARR